MQFKFQFCPGMDAKSKRPFMPISIEEAAEQGIHVPLIIGHTHHESFSLLKCNVLFDICIYRYISSLPNKKERPYPGIRLKNALSLVGEGFIHEFACKVRPFSTGFRDGAFLFGSENILVYKNTRNN